MSALAALVLALTGAPVPAAAAQGDPLVLPTTLPVGRLAEAGG